MAASWAEMVQFTRSPIDTMPTSLCPQRTGRWRTRWLVISRMHSSTLCSGVADTTGPDWEADRQALLDRSLSLAEMLNRRNLILRSDLLRPWSRWITPAVEPRRFDARFFAAALPAGQRTRDVGGEAAAVQWITPARALDAGRQGQIYLWLPTAMTLAELAEYPDVEAVLAAPRNIQPLLPEVVVAEDATWLKVPGEREYPL